MMARCMRRAASRASDPWRIPRAIAEMISVTARSETKTSSLSFTISLNSSLSGSGR